jgi:hypothetical protein
MFFGVEMGTVLTEVAPALDPGRQAAWTDSLARAADYVVNGGFSTWYANGNLNLGDVELLYLAWRATGAPRFQTAYESAWSFVLAPPQDKFPGDGLRIVKEPSNPDGSDGAGYLAENGPGGVGFDAEYSELQLDVASRLYLLSGDARALRLANLLVNMLLPRVGSDWLLDTSGGTRHTEPNRKVPFLTSALAVLGWRAEEGIWPALSPAPRRDDHAVRVLLEPDQRRLPPRARQRHLRYRDGRGAGQPGSRRGSAGCAAVGVSQQAQRRRRAGPSRYPGVERHLREAAPRSLRHDPSCARASPPRRTRSVVPRSRGLADGQDAEGPGPALQVFDHAAAFRPPDVPSACARSCAACPHQRPCALPA